MNSKVKDILDLFYIDNISHKYYINLNNTIKESEYYELMTTYRNYIVKSVSLDLMYDQLQVDKLAVDSYVYDEIKEYVNNITIPNNVIYPILNITLYLERSDT